MFPSFLAVSFDVSENFKLVNSQMALFQVLPFAAKRVSLNFRPNFVWKFSHFI